MHEIILHRVYENPHQLKGFKILVDRLWPRGIKKEALIHDWWAKDIAPSATIHKNFHHDQKNFSAFKKDYLEELNENEFSAEFLTTVKNKLKEEDVIFLYGAKDKQDNQAVVLKEWVLAK